MLLMSDSAEKWKESFKVNIAAKCIEGSNCDSPTKPTRFNRIQLSGPKKGEFCPALPLLIPERFTKSAF
jgi:hypothetical protein